MTNSGLSILAIGATGSIGWHMVRTALASGHRVRALARDPGRANMAANVELAKADLTRTETLATALDGIDAIVLTPGSHGGTRAAKAVDYAAVCNVWRFWMGARCGLGC